MHVPLCLYDYAENVMTESINRVFIIVIDKPFVSKKFNFLVFF